ncbi:tetratricopeptide repeat protein [Sedimenticola selenatireducens]|uniref:Tetratricopeptide repeat protein n=1 Tax=Sedimenticola selenatireducens TaxID=191960 RepID=A0A557RXG4_9GAMM|nr:tetratricopeptide repeat protein [Sedimenticola selenatireducens]TVO69855.1 hypothetical protein FHP88_17440 [Sedimenticola selenatireducens]TVT63184.1 MAG: hypothetical protein FHK78_12105 [Sedimenticola selenatireducens]
MGDTHYRALIRVAVALTTAWIGWTYYDTEIRDAGPDAHELSAAGRYLEDGAFDKALAAFDKAYERNPDNTGALRGKAQSLMRMGLQQLLEAHQLEQANSAMKAATVRQAATTRLQTALALYDESIKQEQNKGINDANRRAVGVAHANRGILKDQLADYPGALADYQMSLKLAPEIQEGPGFLTRFMRNQPEKPPSIADRARYLKEQLAKPADERLLRLPEEDAKQRSYKLD